MANEKYRGRDWLGDVILGISEGFSKKPKVSMAEAQRAGLPEGAGVSPQIFQALMGERRAGAPDPYKERAMAAREANVGLSQKRLDFAKEQQVAREEFQKQGLDLKRQGLKNIIDYRARTDPNFAGKLRVALELMKRKDLSADEQAFVQTFGFELTQQGDVTYEDIDIMRKDPTYFQRAMAGVKAGAKAVGGALGLTGKPKKGKKDSLGLGT